MASLRSAGMVSTCGARRSWLHGELTPAPRHLHHQHSPWVPPHSRAGSDPATAQRCGGKAARSAAGLAAAAASAAAASAAAPQVGDAKAALLAALAGTERGRATTSLQRAEVEEAQVAVEAFGGDELGYRLLEGTWRLVYTTAADVIPILGLDASAWPGGLGQLLQMPLRIGDICQRFTAVEEGVVENIIAFSVPLLTEEDAGVTFKVKASYQVRGPHTISLVFDEAALGWVKPSPTLETLLAPALLPRGSWNQQLLLGLREAQLRFPFRSAQQVAAGRPVGASYQLTYLDQDMLIGRASTPAGSFIFARVPTTPGEEH